MKIKAAGDSSDISMEIDKTQNNVIGSKGRELRFLDYLEVPLRPKKTLLFFSLDFKTMLA